MKSLVLLSGGLDSMVNFTKAYEETEVFAIMTFDYGQTSSFREIEAAKSISIKYNVKHILVELDWIKSIDKGLTKGNIPDFDAEKLDDHEYSMASAKAVWVPNRNGVMINTAAAYADRYEIDRIIVGFNKEEGATFPDNSREYVDRVNEALKYSTAYPVQVDCYTLDMDKTEIVRMGMELSAPFEFVWSCYYGEAKMCGKCESCQRLKRALDQAGYTQQFLKYHRLGFRE